ncbi:MAG: phasin family protein [Thalassospira sp.]|uniref:phasin family protein n=1 Tax=Thalassospira sp. TaxID=1912094 RepID=UPI001AFED546|nr:phasin family protein [Thalassospira sp.]MBO6580688.1 phasin family protein [Thalassospira sp.]MBO6801782.1 phasin family protein [Thalassospira sp.]MBO6819206.1 phasin family protein [Thalassospira sp.]MBO6888497.1 phasin family protein [Thalassospira sp.]
MSTKPKTTATSKSAASAAPKKKTVAKSAPKKAAAAPASTASKSAPAPKAAAPATSEKSAAPATVAAESAGSRPAATPTATQTPSKSTATAKPVDAKPKAEPKQGDVFGFGALFIDGTGMEPYFELWKTPEVEAMVTAGNEAFEESVSAANEAFGKIFETMTGQADVFSGAGSRVAAQYEELLDTQKKSFEEVWQATMAMFEKTGGIGTELSSWMQKEFEASQEDLDELTKVESLADLQELHSRIVNRCYESSLAEGEKMQELMFSAFSDGLNAISKATNVTLK